MILKHFYQISGLALLALSNTNLNAAEAQPEIHPLPQLSQPQAWEWNDQLVGITQKNDFLSIQLDKMSQGETTRLSLKKPIPIPLGQELTYTITSDWIYKLDFRPVVRDANGQEILVFSKSAATLKSGTFLGARFDGGMERLGEVRASTPGMKEIRTGSYIYLDKTGPAQLPFTLIGFQLMSKEGAPKVNSIHLRDFRLTTVDSDNSSLHYQFNRVEQFGELDGLPSLSIGDLDTRNQARSFDIDWDIRQDYGGQPFMTGNESFEIDPQSGDGYGILQTPRIVFPVENEGTYWVRVKARFNSDPAPSRIVEKEFRLFIIKGQPSKMYPIIDTDSRIGESRIRIAPKRKDMVWDIDEDWIVPVRFFDSPGSKSVFQLHDNADTLRLEHTETIGDDGIVELDLRELTAGAYKLSVEVMDADKLMDRTELFIGKRVDSDAIPYLKPKDLKTAQEIIHAPEPTFHLMAHISNKQQDYLEKNLALIDQMKGISDDFEFILRWSEVEPIPGVYDFSMLDKVLDYAQSKNVSVLIWFSFTAPEWLPSHYTKSKDGNIFGHTAYLFHGARLNYLHSPVIRKGMEDFLRQGVLHTRNHPATQGYYYLMEHPGDSPWSDHYVGFDQYTLSDFRKHAQDMYSKIENANQAWRTEFKSFDEIMPPTYGEDATRKFHFDWQRFRTKAISDTLYEFGSMIRKDAPDHLIMVYIQGIMPEDMSKFADLGILTANGGCERPDTFGPGLIRVAEEGIPQRAEEVSVTQWAYKYPTRLDTSFYSMMMGGGSNSHCKMFIPIETVLRNPELGMDSLRKDPIAFDRYEKFQPIWTELRPTEALHGDVRYYADSDARIVAAGFLSTADGTDPWSTRLFLDAQVPFGMAPGKNWTDAKLVVMTQKNLVAMGQSKIDEIVDYVRRGGIVLMDAEVGRYSIEDEDADWVLLKRFGFNPPTGLKPNVYGALNAADGAAFEGYGNLATIRHPWNAGKQPGSTLAYLNDDTTRPSLTELDFGKGKVLVQWSRSTIPPSKSNEIPDMPLVRAVAKLAGADLPTDVDSPYFWTNLLRHKNGRDYYLLVMHYNDGDNPHSTIKLNNIPAGTYALTELINGKDETIERTSQELKEQGVQVDLGHSEVAAFRLKFLNTSSKR
ncbi:beta-galactosidase [Coraliomargarita parva]|uniref:beta-galactosidase n=1 Tax=Coraliomargarita parva TaxID=3014050 RepID=UPI0022B35EC9|nr:beta-galactosidase [Coraliomargarita parva]